MKDEFDSWDIAELIDWMAQNCEIKQAGDPWTGDIWQKWFYYQGEQMLPFQLFAMYIKETNKDPQ